VFRQEVKRNEFNLFPLTRRVGIQTGCETVLSQLANASCGGEKAPKNIPKWKAGHVKNKMKLHAAHVLTMDAILAVGLELGSHAPKCWKHVFRYLLFFFYRSSIVQDSCPYHLSFASLISSAIDHLRNRLNFDLNKSRQKRASQN
jgi:hypothetical protein